MLKMLKGLGGNGTLDAQDGVGNDTVDGGAGTDTCQKGTVDKNLTCP